MTYKLLKFELHCKCTFNTIKCIYFSTRCWIVYRNSLAAGYMLFLHIILTLAFTKVLTHFSTDCFVILSHHVIRNAGGKCSWKQNYDKSLSNIIREPQGKMKYSLLYVPLIICVRQLTSTLLYAPLGKVWRAWNNWTMNSSHGQCAKLKKLPFHDDLGSI